MLIALAHMQPFNGKPRYVHTDKPQEASHELKTNTTETDLLLMSAAGARSCCVPSAKIKAERVLLYS